MSFDTVKAVREGIQRTVTRNGLMLIGVVVLITAIDLIRSVVVHWALIQDSGTLTTDSFASSGFPITAYSFSGVEGQLASEGATTGLLAQVGSFSVTPALSSLVMTFIWAAFWVIATRVFVSDHTDTIPREFVRHNIGVATLNVVVGSIVVSILVTIGYILLIIPGIIISIGMLFVGHEIAVGDENIIDAIRNSWRLMKRFVIQILLVGIVLAILFFLVPIWALPAALLASAVAVLPLWLVGLLVGLLDAVLMVCGIAIAARAYAQLRPSYLRMHWTLSPEPNTADD